MQVILSNKNLFLFPKTIMDAVAVTTNGIVKKDGKAVMGAGIARSARDAFAGIDKKLGDMLRIHGNHAYHLGSYTYRDFDGTALQMQVVTLPTKHNWKNDSDIELIKQSCRELVRIADDNRLRNVYLPAPGCSNGHLDWETVVKPAIEPILDDRFIVVKSMDNTLLHMAMGLK